MEDEGLRDPEIKILNEKLINQISAGEVIERPESVVKELVENSIDANATKIDIVIREGGLKEIVIIDNGHGMDRKNAKIAFESHSTSKINKIDDLLKINTFGFRGEALASIAAVSKVELKTRTKSNATGILIRIKGGEVEKVEEIGCPVGTTISIKNLFYNVPVRKKYLKSSNTEFGHIIEVVSLMAFANPEISFRLLHDDREVLTLPGTGKLLENIARKYTNSVAKNMIKIQYNKEWIKINGYTSNLQETRASKYYITIILNKRIIKNPIITNAILDAYRTLLMKNKYPMTIIDITIDPTLIDVNVHPTKKEVRFSRENEIYDIVQNAIKKALDNIRIIKEVKFENKQRKLIENELISIKKVKPINNELRITQNTQKKLSESITALSDSDTREKGDEILQTMGKLPSMKYIGQVLNTYLITSNKENIYLLDQHAAHERIRLERLVKINNEKPIRTQKLISPIKVEILPGDVVDTKEIIPMLCEFGFDITHFGGTTFVVKGAPVFIKKILKVKEIKELLDELLHVKGKLSLKDARNEVMKLLACKGAIKANTPLPPEKARKLIKDLDKCQNPYSCCHGRPTIISFSKKEIEKKFKRIV